MRALAMAAAGGGPAIKAPGDDRLTSYVGMMVALASWAMLFTSLMLAYLILRVQQPMWPPAGSAPLPLGLAAANTAILLASSGALARGQFRLRAGDRAAMSRWLGVALALGVTFLALQVVLWMRTREAGLALSGVLGSVFYVLSGLHAVHVVGGIAALAWLLRRVVRPMGRALGVPLTMVSLFWHFLDVVWVAMFLGIFLL